MKNIFRNKKVLISVIVAVVIIAIAIVLFVVLGKSGDSKKSNSNSTIKFSNDKDLGSGGNKPQNDNNDNKISNDSENKTGNAITNNNSSEQPIIGSNVDDFYVNATEQFIKAFMDADEMQKFLDDYVDMKAYVAYENVKGDDSKFMNEYVSLSDDDPKIEETKQSCLAFPATYNMMINFIDVMIKQAEGLTNQLGNSVNVDEESNVDWKNLTEEDKKLVLKEIANPEKSAADEHITKIKITCALMQDDSDLYMVFYDDIVIFVCDEDGSSLAESMGESGMDFSGLDGLN